MKALKLNPKALTRTLGSEIRKKGPRLCTIASVASIGIAVTTAIKASPEVMDIIHEAEKKKGEKLTKKEVVEETWKCYIPTAAATASAIFFTIASDVMNEKRIATLTAAYTLASTVANDCKKKEFEETKETGGEGKTDQNGKKRTIAKPVDEIIETGHGSVLCYDALSGRYFTSCKEDLRRAFNDITWVMINETGVSLNELYYSIGLDGIKLGDRLGWSVDRGQVQIKFTSQLTPDGRPCLVMDFDTMPYEY